MRKQHGFTLIEMALVLVVIGLLLGGVLKGQTMIENARTKNLIKDSNAYLAAVHTYRDQYHQLPGDDKGASIRGNAWKNTADGDGNGRIDGDTEALQFWNHLRAAGLVTGEIKDKGNEPETAFNGKAEVKSAVAGFSTSSICYSNTLGRAASAMDAEQDDGNPATGSIRALETTSSGASATPATSYSEDDRYVVCRQI
ncbi:prepilin-type N-terminal cleavage/methylation domain-containing protein [Burkholderiaceae bacterium DAT-1]|nr:prepilin-type N-terminal cleavage/methylation domain-containing protein [Burkholderiaceae bacterium DAT-1]